MKILQLIQNLNHEVINMLHNSINSSMIRNNIHFDYWKVSVSLHEGSSIHVNCNVIRKNEEKTYTICVMTDDVLYALCDTSIYGKYHDENQSVMEIIDESSTVDDVVERFMNYITHNI